MARRPCARRRGAACAAILALLWPAAPVREAAAQVVEAPLGRPGLPAPAGGAVPVFSPVPSTALLPGGFPGAVLPAPALPPAVPGALPEPAPDLPGPFAVLSQSPATVEDRRPAEGAALREGAVFDGSGPSVESSPESLESVETKDESVDGGEDATHDALADRDAWPLAQVRGRASESLRRDLGELGFKTRRRGAAHAALPSSGPLEFAPPPPRRDLPPRARPSAHTVANMAGTVDLGRYRAPAGLDGSRRLYKALHHAAMAGFFLVTSLALGPVPAAVTWLAAAIGPPFSGASSKSRGDDGLASTLSPQESAALRERAVGINRRLVARLGFSGDLAPRLEVSNAEGAHNAFVTGTRFSSAVIGIGESYHRKDDEMLAWTLGHELGHLVSRDSRDFMWFRRPEGYVSFRRMWRFLLPAATLLHVTAAIALGAGFSLPFGLPFLFVGLLPSADPVSLVILFLSAAVAGRAARWSFLAAMAAQRMKELKADHFGAWLTRPEWGISDLAHSQAEVDPWLRQQLPPAGVRAYWRNSDHPDYGTRLALLEGMLEKESPPGMSYAFPPEYGPITFRVALLRPLRTWFKTAPRDSLAGLPGGLRLEDYRAPAGLTWARRATWALHWAVLPAAAALFLWAFGAAAVLGGAAAWALSPRAPATVVPPAAEERPPVLLTLADMRRESLRQRAEKAVSALQRRIGRSPESGLVSLKVSESPSFNAGAHGQGLGKGSHIVIGGLFWAASDAEMAAVLAHEMGHLHHGDSGTPFWMDGREDLLDKVGLAAAAWRYAVGIALILPFALEVMGGGSGLEFLFDDLTVSALLKALAALAVPLLVLLGGAAGFASHRWAELRADHFAAWLTRPEWVGVFLLRVLAYTETVEARLLASGRRMRGVFSTHPSPKERLRRLDR